MANFSAATGLSPVGTITGAPFNEQGTLFAISGDDSTNSYAIGDVVAITAGNDANGIGTITKSAASTKSVGVIVGIQPVDAGVSLQGTALDLSKLWLTINSNPGGYRYAYVVTDPNVVFQVQAAGSVTGKVGSTAALVVPAANQTSLAQSAPFSNEYVTVDASATLASMFQIVGVAQRPDNSVGTYNKVLVKFQIHQ